MSSTATSYQHISRRCKFQISGVNNKLITLTKNLLSLRSQNYPQSKLPLSTNNLNHRITQT